MIKDACLHIEDLSQTDRDVVFALIRSDFVRMSNGRHGLTEDSQHVTALGYRRDAEPKKKESNDGEGNDDEPEENEDKTYLDPLNPTYTDNTQQLYCLYSNTASRQQQEIIKVAPHTVSPLQTIDSEQDAYLSE